MRSVKHPSGVSEGAALPVCPTVRMEKMMTQAKLPSDATVRDVARDTYARGVLDNMWHCRKKVGEPVVRIGVTGIGVCPNYRIEYVDKIKDKIKIFGTYRGSGDHSPLFTGNEGLRDEHWSTETMTLEDVAQLRSELQKAKKW